MRITLKIILFPLTLALSIIVLFLRFIHICSTGFLSVIAVLLFLLGAGIWLLGLMGAPMLQGYGAECLIMVVTAFLISPLGLPFAAGALIEGIDMFNGMLKDI